jgi:hypothetical protein
MELDLGACRVNDNGADVVFKNPLAFDSGCLVPDVSKWGFLKQGKGFVKRFETPYLSPV